ncbi:hypothetical protein GW17_00044663 [Ensete ventricosum]|nr:hypothetical protein GW17_00044663 [Ensete ventricosum]
MSRLACQAIVRRKRYLLDHLSRPLRPCSSFWRFGHGGYTHDTHTRIPHQVSEWSPGEAESSGRRWDALIRAKEDLTGVYDKEFFQHPSGGIPISGFGRGKQEFVLPFAFRGSHIGFLRRLVFLRGDEGEALPRLPARGGGRCLVLPLEDEASSSSGMRRRLVFSCGDETTPRLPARGRDSASSSRGDEAPRRFSRKARLCLILVRRIKEDDKLIQAEGVESLSEEERRQACQERGHLGLLSTEEMCQQVFLTRTVFQFL